MANENKPPAKPAAVKVGDTVNVVLADGTPAPATVKAVNGEALDLQFEHREAAITMTGTPYDPAAAKPDTWHRI